MLHDTIAILEPRFEDADVRLCVLADIFPEDEPVARLIFRLAALREDLRFENAALGFADWPRLSNGDPWQARLYFVRRTAQTLSELCKSLFAPQPDGAEVVQVLREHLSGLEETQGGDIDLDELRTLFEERVERLRSAWPQIKAVRDEASAHLSRDRSREVLRRFSKLSGPIVMGENQVSTYYGLACHAVGFALVPSGTELEDVDAGMSALLSELLRASQAAFELVEIVMLPRLLIDGAFEAGAPATDSSPDALRIGREAAAHADGP